MQQVNGKSRPATQTCRVGALPLRLKVLYITTLHRTGGWLAEAFSADSATAVALEEAVGATAGLARLRDEIFDAVLISHEPGVLDAVRLIEGLRAGGADEPMIILGTISRQEIEAECYEVGADAYCCVEQTTTRSLLWIFSRAFERCHLLRENRRLNEADRQRLVQEHREAERLLEQQRALVADLETLRDEPLVEGAPSPVDAGVALDTRDLRRPFDKSLRARVGAASTLSVPESLVRHYSEMLRTYVVMGQGNLAHEMTNLADLLASANISARETMQLHVHVLEDLVHGLGNRSARHVLHRADLLVLEVLVLLADRYRDGLAARFHPPQQLLLPGFHGAPLNAAAA